ncbi:hypothetical protein R3P38DRAFT_1795411 [Favolaschia claudopus]|uniref:Uncharacterized protein n=1 Tax=Favolaschia claudopus TaxID=2862362 RepID=A0AAW0A6B0_9AGAR
MSRGETFVIYTPPGHRLQQPQDGALSHNDSLSRCELGTYPGQCTVCVYQPVVAAAWIEQNWDNFHLTLAKDRAWDMPLPCMLSPEESAIAIFGSFRDPVIVQTAQSLADASGFPVMIRPSDDTPTSTLLPGETSESPPGPSYLRSGNDTNYSNSARPQLPNQDESLNGSMSEHISEDAPEDGSGRPYHNGTPNNDIEGSGSTLDKHANLGSGVGGGGGGDGGKPTATDDEWESPLHRTRVRLSLKLNDVQSYMVCVGCSFKFKINHNPETPITLENLTQPLSRPEVVSLVDIEIETRPREAQVDRSYANFGFVSHRKQSIIKRTFLNRGFEHPEKIYKHAKQREVQRGVRANMGFSQASPLFTAALSYNHNNTFALEATDNKVLPKCRVDHEPGDEWDTDDKSFSSYNIVYRPQDEVFEVERGPLELRVGMGINTHPSGSAQPLPKISFVNRKQVLIWVADPTSKAKIRGILVAMTNYFDDIKSPTAICISENQQVNLDGASTGSQPKPEQGNSGTISLLIAGVQRATSYTPRLQSVFPKYTRRPPATVASNIPSHEYLARGWDVNNSEWRKVLWPALDKDFRAAEYEGTPSLWRIQCPPRLLGNVPTQNRQ